MNFYPLLVFVLYILITQSRTINSGDGELKRQRVTIDTRFGQGTDELVNRKVSAVEITPWKKGTENMERFVIHRSDKDLKSGNKSSENYNKNMKHISTKYRLQKRDVQTDKTVNSIINKIKKYYSKHKHLAASSSNSDPHQVPVLGPPPGPVSKKSKIKTKSVLRGAKKLHRHHVKQDSKHHHKPTYHKSSLKHHLKLVTRHHHKSKPTNHPKSAPRHDPQPTPSPHLEPPPRFRLKSALRHTVKPVPRHHPKPVPRHHPKPVPRHHPKPVPRHHPKPVPIHHPKPVPSHHPKPAPRHHLELTTIQAIPELSSKSEKYLVTTLSSTLAPVTIKPVVLATPPITPSQITHRLKKKHKKRKRIEIQTVTPTGDDVLDKMIAQVKHDTYEEKRKRKRKKHRSRKKFHIRIVYKHRKKSPVKLSKIHAMSDAD